MSVIVDQYSKKSDERTVSLGALFYIGVQKKFLILRNISLYTGFNNYNFWDLIVT